MKTQDAWAGPAPTPEEAALFAANEAAAQIYGEALRARAKPGSDSFVCAQQLRERGITSQLAELFGLGFAAGGQALGRRFRAMPQVSKAASESAGLVFDSGGQARVEDCGLAIHGR